jgi:DNA-binding transcriptional MerR regulator
MDDGMTIDQLASTAGVPSRTIRQYQTAGLLPPPQRRGRVGIYRDEHVARLGLIARLQTRGYSLAGMRDLLDAWESGGALADVIGEGAARLVPVDEMATLCTTGQLTEVLPALADPRVRRAAQRTGLIHRASTGRGDWVVCSPSAFVVAADVVAQGADPVAVIEWFGQLYASLSAVASDIVAAVDGAFDDRSMTELVRRNRAPLSRAVATLFVNAVGNSLTAAQRRAVRIGAVDDRRSRRSD